MGSPRACAGAGPPAGVPSSAAAETGPGPLWLHPKMLVGLGKPGCPPLHSPCPRPCMCSGPHSASSAAAIFIPCSFQSTALVGGMGQQEQTGSRGARETLCLSKGSRPLPGGLPALCLDEKFKTVTVIRPHSASELVCEARGPHPQHLQARC